jgi:WD40 repeat protein
MKEPGRKISGTLMGALLVGFAVQAAAATVTPAVDHLFAFRADHMVLDAALVGPRVLVATQSGHVDAFDWRGGDSGGLLHATIRPADTAFPPTVTAVAISPSGALCAVVSSDGLVEFYRVAGERFVDPVSRLQLPNVLTARFVADDRLLVGDRRGEVALVEVPSGREIYRRQLEYDPIYGLALSPDGRRVAVAFRSSRIQIVSVDSGATLHVLKGHRDSVYGLAWLSDEELLSGSKDKSVLHWNLAQLGDAPRLVYSADHYVTALGIDRRDGLVALPLEEHQVGVLRIADGRVLRRFGGHTGPIQSLLFSDDGERLISAGNDAWVFVWDLSDKSDKSKGELQ